MSTNFPGAIDSFVDPTPTQKLNNPQHNIQHSNANDAIVAVQTAIGITNSTDTNSIQHQMTYLYNQIAGESSPTALINAETTRAETAENNLSTSVSSLQRTVAALQSTAWVANQPYIAEAMVSYGSGLYQAPSAGVPARATFTVSDWIHLGDITLPVGTTAGTVAAGNDSRIVGAATATNLNNEISRAEGVEATKASLMTVAGSTISITGTTATINEINSVTSSGGTMTVDLPTGQSNGTWLAILNVSTHTVTISGSISGSTGILTLPYQYDIIWLLADASGSWWPLSAYRSTAATDARYDAAGTASSLVTTETSRAETAEAAALQKSNNLSDLSSVSTARTNLGLGTAATAASTAFDVAGAASTAQTNAENFATSAVNTASSAALQKTNNLSDLSNISTARANLGLTTGQIFLSAAGMWPSITNGCGINTQSQTTSNLENIYTLSFAHSSTSSAEATLVMPWDWNVGTVTAQFYWMANDTTANAVVWGCQGTAYNKGSAIDSPWGTQQTVTDTNASTANQVRISSATGAITIVNASSASSLIQFRIQRLGANGADTMTTGAQLLGVLITYIKS